MNTLPEVLNSQRLVIREPRESELLELETHIRATTGLIGFNPEWSSNYSMNRMSKLLTCNGNDYSNTGVFKLLVILEKSSNVMIGMCRIGAHDHPLSWAAPFEYDIVLFNGYRRYGYGTEATSLVLNSITKYCFEDSNLAIIMARVSPDNASSIKTFAKKELAFHFVYPASVIHGLNHIYLRHMFGEYDNIKRVFDYREGNFKYNNELRVMREKYAQLMKTGMYAEAMKVCNMILEESPEAAWQYHDRSICNYKLGRLDEAINDCHIAVSIHPYLSITYYALGSYLMDKKLYGMAIKAFSDAIAIDNSQSDWYYNRMICYRALGDYESAISDCREMIRLGDPEGAIVMNELIRAVN